jgi:hypothetical protein
MRNEVNESADFPPRVVKTKWPPPPRIIERVSQLDFGGVEFSPTDLQVVGALPRGVFALIGWATTARTVFLDDECALHIRERRGLRTARFCLKNMAQVVMEPEYWRPYRQQVRCVDLMKSIGGRPLIVGVKLVPQAEAVGSPIDEIWVRTAYPVSIKILSALARRSSGRWRPIASRDADH